MNLINQLSSALGEKTQVGNRNVTSQCLEHPARLQEITAGLQNT